MESIEADILRDANEAGAVARVLMKLAARFSVPVACEYHKQTTSWRDWASNAFVALEGEKRDEAMLWTIFAILVILWLVGMLSSYTLGGLIYLLLVAALIVLIIQLVTGRRNVV